MQASQPTHWSQQRPCVCHAWDLLLNSAMPLLSVPLLPLYSPLPLGVPHYTQPVSGPSMQCPRPSV
jgi:hypothetical protein